MVNMYPFSMLDIVFLINTDKINI